MIIAALAAAVLATIALPHGLRLRRAEPVAAGALWAAALGLRALVVLGAISGALALAHPAHLLVAFAEWPCAPQHRLAGHAFAALGGLALAMSLLWALGRVGQAAFAVRRLVRHPLGRGPQGSLIIGGDDVVLAAAGLAHPAVLVSAGALAHLDDAELDAALAHERAHIRRRHRWVMLYAELCRSIARVLPGTNRAADELRFQLERDADSQATSDRAQRLALASAICKAGAPARGAFGLAGDGAVARVSELLEGADDGRALRRTLRAVAASAFALALGVALALPGLLSGLGEPAALCPV